MSLTVDLNDVAQAYKEQRNALADHNAILSAANGALQRKVEKLETELKALKEEKEEAKNGVGQSE